MGKRVPEKIMFSIETGNVINISCVLYPPNTRKHFGKILQRLNTFNILKK